MAILVRTAVCTCRTRKISDTYNTCSAAAAAAAAGRCGGLAGCFRLSARDLYCLNECLSIGKIRQETITSSAH